MDQWQTCGTEDSIKVMFNPNYGIVWNVVLYASDYRDGLLFLLPKCCHMYEPRLLSN